MAVGDKIQIRQGPSGTFLEGSADNEVPLWDNTQRLWGAGPVPVVPYRNLTDVVYVDNGGTAPATPDGNIESPFVTFDAAQLTSPKVMLVTPGNYLGEGVISFIPPGGTVYGLGDTYGVPSFIFVCPLLPLLDLAPPPGDNEFFFENVAVTIDGANANVDTVTFRNCRAISNDGASYFTRVEGGSFQGECGGGGIFARNTTLDIAVDLFSGAAFNRFEVCTVNSGCNFTFDAAGGVLQVDCSTVASMHLAASTVVDGGVRVLDGPTLALQWGALSANNNDFLNASARKQTAANAASTDVWEGVQTRRFAHTIAANLRVAHANDVTFTLFAGATVAALAATALAVTIPAGQTAATFDLDTSLVTLAAGSVVAVQVTSAAALAANSMECVVGLS